MKVVGWVFILVVSLENEKEEFFLFLNSGWLNNFVVFLEFFFSVVRELNNLLGGVVEVLKSFLEDEELVFDVLEIIFLFKYIRW